MAQKYFPLRWESTGDHQWWFASPIDYAAANGHYDLVRELLRLDTNLLIKLTSLRRIRRLESLWDDDSRFVDAARCRGSVARSLLKECEEKDGKNSLMKAGYGGWLLYTAASAGDMAFVQDLLERDPLLVFGEGEYGLTDILYAASRGKSIEIFKVILDFSLSPRGFGGGSRDDEVSMFTFEVINRAVHAAARGGNLEMLKELLKGCDDVLAYRDINGSTVLHAASGRGQVEVVDFLINAFLLINSHDKNGNTALHIAAFRGHQLVIQTLIAFSPSLVSFINKNGDTFLHMAVAGFRTPGFKRLDRQMELMKTLINEDYNNFLDRIINVQNNQGRTVLHMAVTDNFRSDLVELLMSVRSIVLNLRDSDGFTPLDLLKQQPRSPSNEILIKELILAGGISNSKNNVRKPYIPSNFRLQGFGASPGTLFKISDAEIILCAGIDAKGGANNSGRPSSCSDASKGEVRCALNNGCLIDRRKSSLDKATSRIKSLLQWPRQIKEKKNDSPIRVLDVEMPTPLRQRFSKQTSLANNKRTLAVRNNTPSPVTKKKFASGLIHGVIHAMPLLTPVSKPLNDVKQKGICMDSDVASCSNSNSIETLSGSKENSGSQGKTGEVKSSVMNHYFCFGAQGLAIEDPVTGRSSSRIFKRSVLSAA